MTCPEGESSGGARTDFRRRSREKFIKEQKKYCNSYQRQIKYTSMQSFYFSMHAVGFVRLPRKNSYTQEVRK